MKEGWQNDSKVEVEHAAVGSPFFDFTIEELKKIKNQISFSILEDV